MGAPPAELDDGAKRAWREVVQRATPGALTWRHRLWLEGLACLIARMRSDEWTGSPSDQARLHTALVRLGLVPLT